VVAPAPKRVDPEAVRAAAMQLRLDGKPAEAAKLLRELLDGGHGDAAAWRELGQCLLDEGDHPEKAREAFDRCLKTNPQDVEALVGTADACGLQGDFAEQARHLEAATALDPDDPETHFKLGLAYDQLEDFPKLLERFQTAVKLDAAYKKRIASVLKNLRGAHKVARELELILQMTETTQLSDAQISEFANRFARMFGVEEPTGDQLKDASERFKGFMSGGKNP